MKNHVTDGSRQNERHARWCDPAQHARAAAELGEPGCVGRRFEVDGFDGFGWWCQDPGEDPRFYVQYGQHSSRMLSIEDLRLLAAVLLRADRVDPLLSAVSTAISDYAVGIPATV